MAHQCITPPPPPPSILALFFSHSLSPSCSSCFLFSFFFGVLASQNDFWLSLPLHPHPIPFLFSSIRLCGRGVLYGRDAQGLEGSQDTQLNSAKMQNVMRDVDCVSPLLWRWQLHILSWKYSSLLKGDSGGDVSPMLAPLVTPPPEVGR